jgi:hypothetical protein
MSLTIRSLPISGNHATITGTGLVGHSMVTYKVEVSDVDSGRHDTFAISWPGYAASGTLKAGTS